MQGETRTGKFFSDAELGTVCGLSRPVVQNYIGALEALYLFERVPAWTKTDYAKAGKRDKWYACDPGLVPNLLGWREPEARDDPDRSGKLLETWVHHELAVRADLGGKQCRPFRQGTLRRSDDDLLRHLTRETGQGQTARIRADQAPSSDLG